MHESQPIKPQRGLSGRLDRLREVTRSEAFYQALIIGAASLLCLMIFILTITPRRYNLFIGMVPNQTISANKDVIDELTTLKNREAAAAAIIPIYHYQDGVTEQVQSSLEDVYVQMVAVRQYAQSLPEYSATRVYTESEFATARDLIPLVPLYDYQLSTLMNASNEQFDEMYAAMNPSIRNTMQGNVTQGQENVAITGIMQVVGFKTNVNLLQNVVLPVLQTIIVPNMVVDEEATEKARLAAFQAVEPVVFKQGQNIVVQGEGRIKENQMEMLDSLGLLNNRQVDYAMYIGSGLMAVVILAMMAFFLSLYCKDLFSSIKRLLIFYLCAVFTLGLSWLSKSIQMIYLAPLLMPFMLLTLTLGILPAVIQGTSLALIASLMLTNTGSANADLLNLLTMSIVAGTFSSLLLNHRFQRAHVLFSGTLVSISCFLIVLSIGLMTSMSIQNTVNKALWAMGGGAVSTLLTLALQPTVESMFNLPTPMRLLDLTNPNHPLLRRLLMEAPGTYHHSIIIANLAEASAEAIGADPLLARAGAYFHDIGKLRRPLYFKENQIGSVNIHDNTDPAVSAAIITSHIREGITLAKQYRLPYEIQQIISEHHGNSIVAFFYHKAINENEGQQTDESEFRYDGVPPRTAEGALIMLCDTIEAAIRTLANPTSQEISDFIDKLIQSKIDSGMLANAPLTLKDLRLVRDSCASVIHGVFHERIEYPPVPDKLPPGERLLAHIQQLRPGSRGSTAIPGKSMAAPNSSISILNKQADQVLAEAVGAADPKAKPTQTVDKESAIDNSKKEVNSDS